MSAIEIPDGSPFGLENLPYGVFTPLAGGPPARVGVRVADSVVDLAALLGEEVFAAPSLNLFMAQGPARWAQVRARLTELIAAGRVPDGAVHPVAGVELRLPFQVGDYVDFYASEHHAANLGALLRPNASPLLPNWKHLPVSYHGRSGTVVVSGTDIVRPAGQRKGPGDPVPVFGPSTRLDIEAEVGFVVGAGSPLGTAVPTGAFADHVFGVVLVNDWSARDLQAWEYVPLGPHLGKSFATSVSAWVVPLAALTSARVPLPGQAPEPLPYLRESEDWGLDIDLAVEWNGMVVSRPPYSAMYWSPAQMLAHMTVNGASLRTGDLFASGTVSGPGRAERGAFIELTWGGGEPVTVNGMPRTFLEDGDTVTITATAPGTAGGRVALGEVTGTILPARPQPGHPLSLSPAHDPTGGEAMRPERSLDWMREGTRRLITDLAGLPDTALDAPTALPGWNRRFLLAHVAANAGALRNLVHWARTGQERRMYASAEQRDADIAAGAARPAAGLRAWVESSAADLDADLDGLGDGPAWNATVITAQGLSRTASEIPWMRAREVCIHAVDLAAGTGFASLPADFLTALLDDVTARRSVTGGGPALIAAATDTGGRWDVTGAGAPVPVTGALADLAAWLTGRPAPALPAAPVLPPWL